MIYPAKNHYERAFEAWLEEHCIDHVPVDQSKRFCPSREKAKTFDYILYPPSGRAFIVELKGRIYNGVSLEKLTGLENWVTIDDVQSLFKWETAFNRTSRISTGPSRFDDSYKPIFVFAYMFKNPDVDPDGRDIFEYDGRSYFFTAVPLDLYARSMKQRSGKWHTVNIPAKRFGSILQPVQEFLS